VSLGEEEEAKKKEDEEEEVEEEEEEEEEEKREQKKEKVDEFTGPRALRMLFVRSNTSINYKLTIDRPHERTRHKRTLMRP